MKAKCPKCDRLIPASQMNASTDVAVCSNCDETFALSSLVSVANIPKAFRLDRPPPGAWFNNVPGGWRIGATTRSPIAFFLVPFMCIWSGFSLGGIYGSQIVFGEFNWMLSLFGIPFVLGTIAIGSAALMTVLGRVELTMDRGVGRLFTGIGPIGWTRRFDWTEVSKIEEVVGRNNNDGATSRVIALIGQTRIKFGTFLSDARRYYLLQGLQTLLQRGS